MNEFPPLSYLGFQTQFEQNCPYGLCSLFQKACGLGGQNSQRRPHHLTSGRSEASALCFKTLALFTPSGHGCCTWGLQFRIYAFPKTHIFGHFSSLSPGLPLCKRGGLITRDGLDKTVDEQLPCARSTVAGQIAGATTWRGKLGPPAAPPPPAFKTLWLDWAAHRSLGAPLGTLLIRRALSDRSSPRKPGYQETGRAVVLGPTGTSRRHPRAT